MLSQHVKMYKSIDFHTQLSFFLKFCFFYAKTVFIGGRKGGEIVRNLKNRTFYIKGQGDK